MNIHHCVFKILEKNKVSQTDGHTDGQTMWKQYTPPQTKFAGGIITNYYVLWVIIDEN